MRKLLVVVIFLSGLSGCANEAYLQRRQQEADAQNRAVLAYLAAQCGYRGSGDIVQAVRADAALLGCVTVKVEQLNASSRNSASFGQALQGMGSVLMAPTMRPQQNCTTRPDYLGGWVTSCN